MSKLGKRLIASAKGAISSLKNGEMDLVDRDCVILDGNCNCKQPFKDCKYIEDNPQSNTRHIPNDRD